MHTDETRRWRVTLADGEIIEVAGSKVVETDSGSLMVLSSEREPARIFRVWLACEELPRGRNDGPGG